MDHNERDRGRGTEELVFIWGSISRKSTGTKDERK